LPGRPGEPHGFGEAEKAERHNVAKACELLELESARADAARLGETLREMAVKLILVKGKGRWG
jgi:hypothetical protein